MEVGEEEVGEGWGGGGRGGGVGEGEAPFEEAVAVDGGVEGAELGGARGACEGLGGKGWSGGEGEGGGVDLGGC